MKGFLDCSGDEPTFAQWLEKREGITPQRYREVALATASYKEYDEWMDILQEKYRCEMALRRDFLENNPFD